MFYSNLNIKVGKERALQSPHKLLPIYRIGLYININNLTQLTLIICSLSRRLCSPP